MQMLAFDRVISNPCYHYLTFIKELKKISFVLSKIIQKIN